MKVSDRAGGRVENFRADQSGRVERTIVEQLRAEQVRAEQEKRQSVCCIAELRRTEQGKV